jgi:hypothetical protein
MNKFDKECIDKALEEVLNAAGSSLRHYMPYSKDKMRDIMGKIMLDCFAQGVDFKEGVNNENL